MDAVRGFLHDWRLVLLIIHVGVTAAMIVVILLQRSEGGGLGMGRTDALFSVRGQANVLSRMTAIFAGCFFFLSLVMAWSMTDTQRNARSIMDRVPASPTAPGVPGAGGTAPAPAAPAAPTRESRLRQGYGGQALRSSARSEGGRDIPMAARHNVLYAVSP
jgi:preprotein translocase subunit SecG